MSEESLKSECLKDAVFAYILLPSFKFEFSDFSSRSKDPISRVTQTRHNVPFAV